MGRVASAGTTLRPTSCPRTEAAEGESSDAPADTELPTGRSKGSEPSAGWTNSRTDPPSRVRRMSGKPEPATCLDTAAP